MSIAAEILRPFWLSGINAIDGNVKKGLAGWITEKSFQIYSQIQSDKAVLHVSNERELIASFAADANRMSSASFETVCGITQDIDLPKSTAWLVIRSYYSAFFAAHAILRMTGISCTQFDSIQTRAIMSIADLFGYKNGANVNNGFFKCIYNPKDKSLECIKLSSDNGSHAAMWKLFHEQIKQISERILSAKIVTVASQQVAEKLSDLCDSIDTTSAVGKGAWLSHIRNKTNYKHELGTWFPYENRSDYYDSLYQALGKWKNDPLTIGLWLKGRDLQRFIESCALIISLCRVLCCDMGDRCPRGKSFQKFGPVHLLNQIGKKI